MSRKVPIIVSDAVVRNAGALANDRCGDAEGVATIGEGDDRHSLVRDRRDAIGGAHD